MSYFMIIINNQINVFQHILMLGGVFMLDDSFFKKIEKKTKVDKNTIVSLAEKLQKGNMKDERTLSEVIDTLSKMTGKKVNPELKDKIIKKVVNDDVPKNVDKMF